MAANNSRSVKLRQANATIMTTTTQATTGSATQQQSQDQPQQQQQQQTQTQQQLESGKKLKSSNNHKKKTGGNNSNSNNNGNGNAKAKEITKTNTNVKANIVPTKKTKANAENPKNNTNTQQQQQQQQQQPPKENWRKGNKSLSSAAATANVAAANNAVAVAGKNQQQQQQIDRNNNNNANNYRSYSNVVEGGKQQQQQQRFNNSKDVADDKQQQQQIANVATDKNHTDLNGKMSAGEILTAALNIPCAKCSKPSALTTPCYAGSASNNATFKQQLDQLFNYNYNNNNSKTYRKSKSYMGVSRKNYYDYNAAGNSENTNAQQNTNDGKSNNNNKHIRQQYYRSYSDRRNSFDRNFAERNKYFVPIVPPAKPVLSASNIAAVIADTEKLTIIERVGKGRTTYPIMQCGILVAPESNYHQQRSNRMDVYQIDDGFHSDGGTETPPPSPSSGSSIASTSDHGSLESVDTGGTQRLAVLSHEQVRKLHNVMDEKVAIHGRGNFPTLEVTLKDLVNSVRRKLEDDVANGGAGVIVKDIRLNGGAASHVLASEDQPYNDLDLIYAIEFSSSRHFDRVKTAVLNTLLDLLPEGVSKRRIMPCALKEAYVGKMVKVNNNNDGDRWSLISLGNSPGHKNVELKFVDTMRRQFEFSVDSFQIVLDSLLLFYDCAALPISENFYPTVVGESVYGDFQEALYHLRNKLISTRQPEEIRGGGLLKYCNLLVRKYKPVDPQRIKTLERYMCSRFFIDFPDIGTQTVKLEAYLRNHFWGVDEEPLQYQYLMHLREVVEKSTVCLMGHERRQTLLLIQALAAQVLYKEQHRQHQVHAHEQYQQQQQQQEQQYQQQQQHTHNTHQQQQQQLMELQQQPQTIAVLTTAQPQTQSAQAIYACCAMDATQQQQQQQQQQAQQQQQQQTQTQTVQLQTAAPPSLIYANGVYYAPVIPTAICTCNSTWLST